MKITSDSIFKEILGNYPESLQILARHGFHGIACSAEMWIPLRIIAESRGILIEPLIQDLNRLIDEG